MNLKIIRKSILITIIIFTQYLVSVKSSNLIEIQFNDVSNQLLISGWKPSSDKNSKVEKASDNTIKVLNKFKNISSLKTTRGNYYGFQNSCLK